MKQFIAPTPVAPPEPPAPKKPKPAKPAEESTAAKTVEAPISENTPPAAEAAAPTPVDPPASS